MFASQLIYTGCGKDKNGAFSVWSKSEDITKSEEVEIQRMMLYKRPSFLPSEPTNQELDTIFPRKFGYFNLSSGRMCLAQSVYIGSVYSDLDKRTGNYIIHAFVFNKTNEILPMNYINSDIFKRFLTYDEWHDNPTPISLPKFEFIDKTSPLTKREWDSFFNNRDKVEKLKQLLQSILNSTKNQNKITFYDKQENLAFWYKAISFCLPKKCQDSLTFCTFFTPMLSLPSQIQQMNGSVDTDVKIRNISPTIFNYYQEIRNGKYCFDFENGIYPTPIEISNYVNQIVSEIGENPFNVLMTIDSVEKISEKYNCDLDYALNIHYLIYTMQIEKIDNISLLNNLIEDVKSEYPDLLQEIADRLYDYGFASGRWEMHRGILNLYRFVFEYSEVADKKLLVENYLINLCGLGIAENQSPDNYYENVVYIAPFDWVNFTDYIFEPGLLSKYIKDYENNFNMRYLVFRTFAEQINDLAFDEEKKYAALSFFVETVKCSLKKADLDEVLILLNCIGNCGYKWKNWLIEKSLESLLGQKNISEILDVEFVLTLAERLDDIDLSANLVGLIISENKNDSDFAKLFISKYDRNPNFYDSIKAIIEENEEFADFMTVVELYRFSVSSSVSKRQLQEFYGNYYSVGKDNGIFAKKINQYLSSCAVRDIIPESLLCFEEWFSTSKLNESDVECVLIIAKAVFSAPIEELQRFIEKQGAVEIKEILFVIQNSGFQPPSHYYTIILGGYIKRIVESIQRERNSTAKNDVINKLEDESFYKILNDRTAYELLVKMYMPNILGLYLSISSGDKKEVVYEGLFKPLYQYQDFKKYFENSIFELKEKYSDLIIMDTIAIAYNKSNKFNNFLKQFVDSILETMGRGKRNKLFEYILQNVPENYRKNTKAFINQYQKDHETLFEKMFSSLGRDKKADIDDKTNNKKKWKK